MVTGLFRKIFRSRNELVLKKLSKVVDKINSYEEQFIALKDQDFLPVLFDHEILQFSGEIHDPVEHQIALQNH